MPSPYSVKLERFFGVALGAGLSLLAIPAGRADVLIELVESGSDVIATALGSLNLPTSNTITYCGNGPGQNLNGAIDPTIGAICVGPGGTGFEYMINIGGTTSFGTQMGTEANSATGTFFGVNGTQMLLGSPSGTQGLLNVDGKSIFSNKTLADLGISSLGVIGTWTLPDPASGPDQTITLRATPGPLAVLGLPFAYGWSRTLRRRIQKGEPRLSS